MKQIKPVVRNMEILNGTTLQPSNITKIIQNVNGPLIKMIGGMLNSIYTPQEKCTILEFILEELC